jgi:hypothetical protein
MLALKKHHVTSPWTLHNSLLCIYFYFLLSTCFEHDVLERVKNKNKYIVKNCASLWSFTNNYNMMHSQQNVKRRGLG